MQAGRAAPSPEKAFRSSLRSNPVAALLVFDAMGYEPWLAGRWFIGPRRRSREVLRQIECRFAELESSSRVTAPAHSIERARRFEMRRTAFLYISARVASSGYQLEGRSDRLRPRFVRESISLVGSCVSLEHTRFRRASSRSECFEWRYCIAGPRRPVAGGKFGPMVSELSPTVSESSSVGSTSRPAGRASRSAGTRL